MKLTYYKGSCLCAEVTFHVTGFSQQAANCYCSMCRKFHGAAYGTLVSVSGLEFLTGKAQLKEFIANNGTTRTFCNQCGSSIGFCVKDAKLEQMEVAIALFDEDIPVKIDAHIYTNYKSCWTDITDPLPQFSEERQ
jgi:hypothetical protein